MAKTKKRPHPTFARANYGRTSRSRIKDNWRRPRGIDNKKAFKFKYMGCSPSIGYGQPSEIRHNHPQGMKELLAQTPSDLSGAKEVVVRIASGVGAVKREAIQRLAETMKLKILNPKKFVARVPKPKETKKGDAKKEQPRQEEQKKEEPKKETPAAKPAAIAPQAQAPPKQTV